jgi:hypothetical protein
MTGRRSEPALTRRLRELILRTGQHHAAPAAPVLRLDLFERQPLPVDADHPYRP